jgi:hypothetical protein
MDKGSYPFGITVVKIGQIDHEFLVVGFIVVPVFQTAV